MTLDDEIEEGLRWEAERKRRMNYKRKAAFKSALRKSRIELAIMVALVLGYFAFMIWWNIRQPLMERAAYLEGYHGVDHATALAMAKQENVYSATGWYTCLHQCDPTDDGRCKVCGHSIESHICTVAKQKEVAK